MELLGQKETFPSGSDPACLEGSLSIAHDGTYTESEQWAQIYNDGLWYYNLSRALSLSASASVDPGALHAFVSATASADGKGYPLTEAGSSKGIAHYWDVLTIAGAQAGTPVSLG